MDELSIGPGVIIFQKSITNVHPTAELSYKVKKGRLFVSLLLGDVAGGTQYDTDPDKLLNALGYYRKDD